MLTPRSSFFLLIFLITLAIWLCQPHLVVSFYLIKFWFVFKDLTYGTYLRHSFLCFLIPRKHLKMDRKNDNFSSINVFFLMAYSSLIFVCMAALDQRFLITYLPFIFVCVGCLAQQLKINCKYTTIKQWLGTKLFQFRNDPSINIFLMTYLLLIFVWFLYALRMPTHTKNKREYTTIKLWLRTNCARYRHLTSMFQTLLKSNSCIFWILIEQIETYL